MQKNQFLQCTPEHFHQLTAIWERSVQQTHNFLTPADIVQLKVAVLKQYLPMIKNIIGLVDPDADNNIKGFIGIENTHIEMLFVDPIYFRQGVGKQLIVHAIKHYKANRVDVNEQNPAALTFYLQMGFKVIGRSPLDRQGNPFPLLHLQFTNP